VNILPLELHGFSVPQTGVRQELPEVRMKRVNGVEPLELVVMQIKINALIFRCFPRPAA
jgi:hypothetical protein